MAASVKTYTYTLIAGNILPLEENMKIETGALTQVKVTGFVQINNGAVAVLFKRSQKIKQLISCQNITTATGAVVAAAHIFAITADGYGVQVTAAADIPTTTHFRLTFLIGN